MNALIGTSIGIGLSTSSGFRVLIPFFCLSAAAIFGDMTLPPSMEWLDSQVVLLGLGVACLLEVGAFYIPWLNNALDAVELPAAAIAGTYLTGAFAADLPTLVQWSLALVAGGGSASAIHGLTGVTRLASNTATGGCASVVTATIELLSSLMLAVLAITLPLLALGLVIFLVIFAVRRGRRFRSRQL